MMPDPPVGWSLDQEYFELLDRHIDPANCGMMKLVNATASFNAHAHYDIDTFCLLGNNIYYVPLQL